MAIKSYVPGINWNRLQKYLRTDESDPESILHELVHAFDCIGEKAFEGDIGEQSEVGVLIEDKYSNHERWAELGEIKVSAITFLILQNFGHCDLEVIIKNIKWNLSSSFTDSEIDELFLRYVRRDKTKKEAKKIKEFLLSKFR